MTVELPELNELVNDPFISFMEDGARISLLWGGRGSGKTHAVAWKIIIRMLSEPKFKGVLVRKVYENIKESQYEKIKTEIENAGLSSLFNFKVSPLEIKCINGARLIARGMDRATKVKGLDSFCFAWYEEGIELEENDFLTLSTTIRAKGIKLEEVFSFNPEAPEPDYKDNWVYKRFFKDEEGRKNFRKRVEMEIEGESRSYEIESIHSTYKDNKHLPPEAKIIIEDFKNTNPYYYEIYALGEWGNKDIKARFYRAFDIGKTVIDFHEYDNSLPLHVSFDENVHPYLSCVIWQIIPPKYDEKYQAIQIDEICLESPFNTLRDTCNTFIDKYGKHKAGLFVYGDATSRKQDTKLEKGENFFTLIEGFLSQFNPVIRVPKSNPPTKTRGDFMNEIFRGLKNVDVKILSTCKKSIADYLNVQEDAAGTKLKTKVKNKTTGVSYEPYGHTSDANDYFICEAFSSEFSAHSSPSSAINVIFGKKRASKRF